MIYPFPAFALGYLLCFGIVYREMRLKQQRVIELERELAHQRYTNDLLNKVYADTFEEAVNAKDELEDQKLLFAEHQSRCSVLSDDTPIYVDEMEV
jgi:hypothetical protein